MLINERSKRSIAFRPDDAKRVGEGCFYLDQIVWLNGDRIELGDRVGFNYGCYVNGYSGLVIGDDVSFGPYTMIHTADHETSDVPGGTPVADQLCREVLSLPIHPYLDQGSRDRVVREVRRATADSQRARKRSTVAT